MHKAQAHNLVEQSNNKLESGGGVKVWEAQDKAIKERKAGRQAGKHPYHKTPGSSPKCFMILL